MNYDNDEKRLEYFFVLRWKRVRSNQRGKKLKAKAKENQSKRLAICVLVFSLHVKWLSSLNVMRRIDDDGFSQVMLWQIMCENGDILLFALQFPCNRGMISPLKVSTVICFHCYAIKCDCWQWIHFNVNMVVDLHTRMPNEWWLCLRAATRVRQTPSQMCLKIVVDSFQEGSMLSAVHRVWAMRFVAIIKIGNALFPWRSYLIHLHMCLHSTLKYKTE